ncbi:MAG: glutamine synthetase III [Vicingaceae bacterium]
MAVFRFAALEDVVHRKANHVTPPSAKISDFYGSKVFNDHAMQEYLSKDAYESVVSAMIGGERIERRMANAVAAGMKDWAATKGATHYTHWFQPLTGSTAEKHDAFFEPIEGGRAIERFDGSMLVQQEPDASSFPSGGIRNTFEARGYTAWDPSSPAFVIGKTLCIPTIFISYTGHALDNKMPLLKALNAIDKAATDVCHYFDKNVTKVSATLGWEQEYFLIDTALYNARPDIMMTGRALFGHTPAKGQQLDDHYFGTIPERVTAFMRDFENQALELGIPVTTRHNEVAPNQYEVAPVFEEANLANDHNLLLMDLLEKIAVNHNFKVLLHEKPYPGLNGSGKHNNWSLGTNTGVNLLSPGKNPKTNLRFLAFFVNTIAAVYRYSDLIRASIASAGNDHRLGANEAPPAIISVFIGSQLTDMLDAIENSIGNKKLTSEEKTELKLSIGKIPEILLDNTDRNRTSPFAFTGNKFEFRAVGSSANCATPMIAINVAVAKQLREFKTNVDALIRKGIKKDEAILREIRELIVKSKNIRFEGNGYSEKWVTEAKKRGLNNIKDTPRALGVLIDKSTKSLFEELDVLSSSELDARHEIELENYTLKIQIESRAIGDVSQNHIIPTAIEYQNRLIQNVKGMREIFGKKEADEATETQLKILIESSKHINGIKSNVDQMIESRKKGNKIAEPLEKAIFYCDTVRPHFESIKYHVDKLEMLIDDELWPLPKLREVLFTK